MAEEYFGPAGLGLEVVERRAAALELAGPQGRVGVRVQVTDGTTEAYLSCEGLDEEVRRFMAGVYEEAHRR